MARWSLSQIVVRVVHGLTCDWHDTEPGSEEVTRGEKTLCTPENIALLLMGNSATKLRILQDTCACQIFHWSLTVSDKATSFLESMFSIIGIDQHTRTTDLEINEESPEQTGVFNKYVYFNFLMSVLKDAQATSQTVKKKGKGKRSSILSWDSADSLATLFEAFPVFEQIWEATVRTYLM